MDTGTIFALGSSTIIASIVPFVLYSRRATSKEPAGDYHQRHRSFVKEEGGLTQTTPPLHQTRVAGEDCWQQCR